MTIQLPSIIGGGTGTAPATSLTPSLAAFFARHIDRRRCSSARDWLDRWSLVALLGVRLWVMGGTSRDPLARDARLLLLEERRQGARVPARAVLSITAWRSVEGAQRSYAFLDAQGGHPSLVALMAAWPRSTLLVPSRWIPTLDEDLRLSPNERRAVAAGMVRDPAMSARIAQALSQTYGPFALEWLAAVMGKAW